eukprot:gb/GFBE01072977.1/.p1 GENE.gb/GFBE01072977.1/~~gb/GFBE01072977.1/.p1  ORF type:complete len:291 (+),score=48.28 gb/GFBE01072977.1/:1-873(+)
MADTDIKETLAIPIELANPQRVCIGQEAEVFRAVWIREFSSTTSAITIIMKHLFDEHAAVTSDVEALARRPNHVNILKCFEVTTKAPYVAVSECCSGGSLWDSLQDKTWQFPWQQRVKVLLDVSTALECLHSSDLLQRDLRSKSVCLSRRLTDGKLPLAKLDFPLPSFGHLHQVIEPATGAGNWRWMAPETIASGEYSQKSDVFSFGMLMFEVLSRQMPYQEFWDVGTPCSAGGMQIIRGRRPGLELVEAGCPKALLQLMQECWQGNSAARPLMSSICKILAEQVDRVSK